MVYLFNYFQFSTLRNFGPHKCGEQRRLKNGWCPHVWTPKLGNFAPSTCGGQNMGQIPGFAAAGIGMASVMPVTSVHAWAPAGSRPGDTVNVKSPHGQQLQAVIPVGVAAGQPFIVQV